jgi:hypothetical protein
MRGRQPDPQDLRTWDQTAGSSSKTSGQTPARPTSLDLGGPKDLGTVAGGGYEALL